MLASLPTVPQQTGDDLRWTFRAALQVGAACWRTCQQANFKAARSSLIIRAQRALLQPHIRKEEGAQVTPSSAPVEAGGTCTSAVLPSFLLALVASPPAAAGNGHSRISVEVRAAPVGESRGPKLKELRGENVCKGTV